jgi:ABC-2 type transport system permease protein
MSTLSSNNQSSLEQYDRGSEMKSDSILSQIWVTIVLGFRKNLAIFITALLLMLVSLPVILLMLPVKSIDATRISELFGYLVAIPIFIISMVIIVLSAGQMFSYLHNKTAVDIYHALPLRRPTLFVGRFLGGALLGLLPQILAFTAVLLVRLLPGYQILDLSLVIRTASSFLLISLSLYAISVFAFVLTGTLFDAMFLLLMFNIVYPGTLFTIDVIVSRVLPGFSLNDFVSIVNLDRYLYLCPLGELLKVSVQGVFPAAQGIASLEILWWSFLTVVIIAASLLIYMKRPSELAGKPLVYRTPFVIIRGLASLVVGLIFGYLYYNLYSTLPAFIFSAAIGSLATHTLVEVVLSRGFRNYLRSLPSYGITALVLAVGCLIVVTGFIGYDTRLPVEGKVIQVRFETNGGDVSFFAGTPNHGLVFQNPENISDIVAMNKAWLDERQPLIHKPYSLNTNPMLSQWAAKAGYAPYRVTYVLSSGVKIVRSVYFDFTQEPYLSFYKQIRGTAEYKQQQYKYLFMADSTLADLFIDDKTGQISRTINKNSNEEMLVKVLVALRQDVLQNAEGQPGSRLIGYLQVRVFFDLSGPIGPQGIHSTSYHLLLSDAYVNTVAILNAYGLLNNLYANNNQIDAVYITPSRSGSGTILDIIKSRESQGPYILPTQDWTDGQIPPLNDTKVFTKIDNKNLIQILYRAGQDLDAAADDGYLLVFKFADQIGPDGKEIGPAPVLYIPVSQVPREVLEILGK